MDDTDRMDDMDGMGSMDTITMSAKQTPTEVHSTLSILSARVYPRLSPSISSIMSISSMLFLRRQKRLHRG